MNILFCQKKNFCLSTVEGDIGRDFFVIEHAEHAAKWGGGASAMQVSGLVENPYCLCVQHHHAVHVHLWWEEV